MHHSGGKQQMAEVFEIEEIPQASSAQTADSAAQGKKEVTGAGVPSNDKHIPNFDFNGYPLI